MNYFAFDKKKIENIGRYISKGILVGPNSSNSTAEGLTLTMDMKIILPSMSLLRTRFITASVYVIPIHHYEHVLA